MTAETCPECNGESIVAREERESALSERNQARGDEEALRLIVEAAEAFLPVALGLRDGIEPTEEQSAVEIGIKALAARLDEARAERDNLLDASREGAWMARALDAEKALRSPRIPAEARRLVVDARLIADQLRQCDNGRPMAHTADRFCDVSLPAAEAALAAEPTAAPASGPPLRLRPMHDGGGISPTAAARVEVPYDFDSAIRNLEHQASRADSSELNLTMLVLADVLRREAGR